MSAQINIEIPPVWEEVASVRLKTAGFLKKLELSRDLVDAISMVACELTENATKYGQFQQHRERIEVTVEVSGSDVTVQVTNPVAASDQENLKRLDRMVQWIRGFQDPFEAYVQRLKELSAEGMATNESRLGLVRIAYEGQSILDFYVDERDVLAVSAIRRL